MIHPSISSSGGSPRAEKNLPSPPVMLPGSTRWFQRLGQTPFPIAVLPSWLAEYVRCLAAHFMLNPEAVAPLILAQLAGVLGEYRSVRSATGAPVSLSFSVIAAARDTPTLFMALAESCKVLAELQQTHLEVAAGFDRKREKELMEKPRMFLPDDALPARQVEPKEVDNWRARLVRLYRQPLFWMENPGSKELRAGFASSFDRTLLVTCSKGGWLEKLVATKRDREANRLGELLMSLVQGSHITVPGSSKNRTMPQMLQARFSLVGLTARTTLIQAFKDEREDVRTLLSHSVLLDLPKASITAATRPSSVEMEKVGASWKHFITCLLNERRVAESRSLAPHDCFHQCLNGWQNRLQKIATQIPATLHGHLPMFADLPVKLGSLLLAVGQYGVWEDRRAAEAAHQIAEWMLARTVSCAGTAQEDQRRHVMADSREKMFAKIMELGPIDFWRLCRHFDRQSKALHEPTLHALMDERRVRMNEAGKLVAN